MNSRILAFLCVLLLTACAVDTSPIAPDPEVTTDAGGDAVFPDGALDAGDSGVPADSAADSSMADAGMDATADGAADGATDAMADGATDAMADATMDAMADTMTDAVADAPACADGATRCAGDVLETCTGGMWVASACPLGCTDDGDSHCLELAPSNVSSSLFVDTGTIRVSADETWDTDTCAALPRTGMVVSQGMGYPELCVVSANRFFVDAGYTLTVEGSRPLVVLADTRVEIDGVIDVSADEEQPGAGGFGFGDPTSISPMPPGLA